MFALPNGNFCKLKTLRHILLFFILTLVIVAEMDRSIFVIFPVIVILHFQSHRVLVSTTYVKIVFNLHTYICTEM
jgi:hypothetical protein